VFFMCRYFGADSLAFLDAGAIYKSFLHHHVSTIRAVPQSACQNALQAIKGRFIKHLGFGI
jgi:hypothetical protein